MKEHTDQQPADPVFHEGERAVQSRLGVREAVEPWARQAIRSYLPQQHRDFYSHLPFVIASARDNDNRPWVTLLVGPPGFIRSPDPGSLQFATRLLPGDALEGSLVAGAELGLLGIELETRRRNRVNGTITATDANGLRFQVGQAFGNCPQYITPRRWRQVDIDPRRVTTTRHSRLDLSMQQWISSSDTLFIASGYRGTGDGRSTYGMDASHRGGPAGFVRVLSESRLVFPDYAGNNLFNTIGNLVMDPSVGLLFVDFENGHLLQISGKAMIDWNSPEIACHAGARRLVNIEVERVVQLGDVLPLRWRRSEGSVLSLRVVKKTRESVDVMSFELEPQDGGKLPDFEAGQHLPIELRVDGRDQPLTRTYSLSNGPGNGRYRISVKREPLGLVSRHLHDNVRVGDIIRCRKPEGEFVLREGRRPVALVSAGIGVTPMISMLHALASSDRPVFFVHGVRNGDFHPLADEVRKVAASHDKIRLQFVYSQPTVDDAERSSFDREGRLDGDLLKALVPDSDADFYLCGPRAFLAKLTAALGKQGVAAARIRVETF